jgi:hypothetical protein
MPSNPALVDVPLRLWREISSIAASQRAIIVQVNRGHKAYARTEVAGASMLLQVLDGLFIESDSPQDVPDRGPSLEPSPDVYEVIRSPIVLGTA